MTQHSDLAEKKALARAWFAQLQTLIISAFEQLEDEAPAALYPGPPGRFELKPWRRGDGQEDLGGGRGAMMRGRFFEKVGVHFSEVYGAFPADYAKQVPGAAEDPRFWASGVSLIAHMRNPHCPAAHMNTRMIATTQWWFGGGGDLNPTQAYQRHADHADARAFKAPYKAACDAAHPEYFAKYEKWCDEYFWLPHRQEPRGVGGIFYDHHNSGDWQADFAFTQDVGRAFLGAFPPLLRQYMATPWSADDREAQLVQRGRYVEYNLLYDRGTTFGLKTGGNVETILSSMPPEAKWP